MERKRIYRPGEEFQFGLTLIGRAIDYLPYFIYTFEELGRMGIGKGKSGYNLISVHSNGRQIYDSQSKTLKPFHQEEILKSLTPNAELRTLNILFLTPTRIQYNAHLTLDLEFHILIRNLLRRFSLLYYFHCNGDPSNWDFKGLIHLAQGVKVKERKLRWYDWERYSGRQETRMKMGGFVGEITFEGELGPFMPLIKTGEILHVGKGSGFGLGKYEIRKEGREQMSVGTGWRKDDRGRGKGDSEQMLEGKSGGEKVGQKLAPVFGASPELP